MTIPEYITRAQLTDAFAAMGLDAGEVTAWYLNTGDAWITANIRPAGSPRTLEYTRVRIPILDAAPEPQLEPTHHGYTPHGHPCCGYAILEGEPPRAVAKCGGPKVCGKCQWDASVIHDRPPEPAADLLGEMAKEVRG